MRLLALLLALLALASSALAANASLDVPLRTSPVAAAEPVLVAEPARPQAPPSATPPPRAATPTAHVAPPQPEVQGASSPIAPAKVVDSLQPAAVATLAQEVASALAPRERLAEKLWRIEQGARASTPGALPLPMTTHRDGASAQLSLRDPGPSSVSETGRSTRSAEPAPGRAQAHVVEMRAAGVDARSAGHAEAALGLALFLVPMLLYHRLRRARLVGLDTRARLLDALRARPGLAVVDAARAVDVDPSTALYHLRRLVDEGVAVAEGARRAARYFAVGTVPPAQRLRIVAERESEPIIEAIRAEPGASKTRLAQRLAIARASLSWHLGRLERAGLVRCERDGREVKVYLCQETFS